MSPSTVVVDASALVAAVVDASEAGRQARQHLRGRRRVAPFLIDAETGQALRGLVLRGELDADAAVVARRRAEAMIARRHPHHGGLAERAWQLRDRLSFYDALYVGLAESLGHPLVTADAGIGRALDSHELIQVIPAR